MSAETAESRSPAAMYCRFSTSSITRHCLPTPVATTFTLGGRFAAAGLPNLKMASNTVYNNTQYNEQQSGHEHRYGIERRQLDPASARRSSSTAPALTMSPSLNSGTLTDAAFASTVSTSQAGAGRPAGSSARAADQLFTAGYYQSKQSAVSTMVCGSDAGQHDAAGLQWILRRRRGRPVLRNTATS